MTVRSDLLVHAGTSVVWVALLCGLLISRPVASGGKSRDGNVPFRIAVEDAQGGQIAAPYVHPGSAKKDSASLTFEHEYQPGDRLLLGGPQRIAVRVDETFPECLLYFPEASPQATLPMKSLRDAKRSRLEALTRQKCLSASLIKSSSVTSHSD